MGHYAGSRKAKLFKLFDDGKRPADIDKAPVSRQVLFQYYGEWRTEHGIPGKLTGFALKKFDRGAAIKAKEEEKRTKERRHLAAVKAIEEEKRVRERARLLQLASDWEALAVGFRRWGENREETEKVHLPGSGSVTWLGQRLLQKLPGGKSLTKEESARIYQRWAELARLAHDKKDFERLCCERKLGLPPILEGF